MTKKLTDAEIAKIVVKKTAKAVRDQLKLMASEVIPSKGAELAVQFDYAGKRRLMHISLRDA